MDVNKIEVGKRIYIIRKSLGVTMKEFGERVGKPFASDSIVSRWEKGQSLPNNERLKRIAELSNKTVSELIENETSELFFGKRLTAYRKKAKLTQQGLAKESGFSRTYLSDVENGRYRPSVELVKKVTGVLSSKLSVSEEEIFSILMNEAGYSMGSNKSENRQPIIRNDNIKVIKRGDTYEINIKKGESYHFFSLDRNEMIELVNKAMEAVKE